MSVVQLGLSAIIGLVGIVVAQSLKLELAVSAIVGVVGAIVGFLVAGSLVAAPAVPAAVPTKGAKAPKKEKASKEKPKKENKSEKEKAKAEAKEKAEREAEEAAETTKAEKAKKKKKSAKDEPAPAPAAKKSKAAPVKVVESESSEDEDEEDAAPKSKSALKKAKAKAAALKKEAEEKAAAIAAAAAAAAASAKAALEQAAAGGKNKKKKKGVEEEKAPVKATKPTKEEKAALEEGEWETPGAKKSEKNKERKQKKDDEKKALASQPVSTDATSSKSSAEITVAPKSLGALIGTGGETLKKIEEATGCKINVPKRESGSSIVKIEGPDPESVQRCRGTIEALLTKGYSSVTHPGEVQDDITIPEDQIGQIVGPAGAVLKKLQQLTGTRITMPEKTDKSSKAKITGLKDQVKAAKAAIKSLLQDGFSSLTHPDWEKVELAFPREKLGILIGPKGHTIKSIQGNTKTRINIPDKASLDQNVSVVGTPAGIAQAVKEINRLLEPIGGYAAEDDEWVQDNEEAEGQWGIRSTAAQGEEALWD